MSLRTISEGEFERRVVQPIQAGKVYSQDGSDQGALNTLIYQYALFGHHPVVRLSRIYNAPARSFTHSADARRWFESNRPAVIHFSSELKPWLWHKHSASSTAGAATRAMQPLAECYRHACGRYLPPPPNDANRAPCLWASRAGPQEPRRPDHKSPLLLS